MKLWTEREGQHLPHGRFSVWLELLPSSPARTPGGLFVAAFQAEIHPVWGGGTHSANWHTSLSWEVKGAGTGGERLYHEVQGDTGLDFLDLCIGLPNLRKLEDEVAWFQK